MSWQIFAALATIAVIASTNSQYTREQMIRISLKARKLPYDVCGQSNIFNQKLQDGAKATLGAYPWMAALGYSVEHSEQLKWQCAGNLITDQFVLTAGHCITTHFQYKNLKVVRLGDLDLNQSVDDGASPVDVEVEKVIPHPRLDMDYRNENDIGLVKLKNKVQFDSLKKPICLPSPEFYETSFVGRSSIITGWGRSESGDPNTALSEAAIDIDDIESCRRNYTIIRPLVSIDERVICASSPGRGSCNGDSGGPLMMLRRYKGKDKMFLLGTVSYSMGCAREGYPGVYTNVSTFMYWIIDNLEF